MFINLSTHTKDINVNDHGFYIHDHSLNSSSRANHNFKFFADIDFEIVVALIKKNCLPTTVLKLGNNLDMDLLTDQDNWCPMESADWYDKLFYIIGKFNHDVVGIFKYGENFSIWITNEGELTRTEIQNHINVLY